MPADDALRQQAQIYKAKRDELLKKIKRLEIESVRVAAGGLKFQVEQELAEAQLDLRKTDQQLKDIDSDRIYYALMEMDYIPQSIAFDDYLTTHRIGAFVIHGPAGYGQDWLLRRLLELIPRESELQRVDIDLGSRYLSKQVDAVWDQLAQRLNLEPFPPPTREQIARTAASWLETKTVVLLLLQIDAWTPQQASALIEEFWKELVKAAQETLQAGSASRLVMFLVDYSDLVKTWNVPLIDAPAQQVEPSIPIRLQNVSPFTTEIVKPWIENHYVAYKDLLKPLIVNLEQTVQTIIQSSQGVPDEVAKHICIQCKHYYQKERWLKL